MVADLNSPKTIDWLSQFEDPDAILAKELLQNILYVSGSEFRDGLFDLILARIKSEDTPVALYAETEVRAWQSQDDTLFEQQNIENTSRSIGTSIREGVIDSAVSSETGSEGIVRNIITSLTRTNSYPLFNHPGPDVFRANKIRRLFIVADFCGTGGQTIRFLDSIWHSPSFRSWHSSKLVKVEVVCFSATNIAIENISKHRSRPKVHIVQGCPTLNDFKGFGGEKYISLCRRYGPKSRERNLPALGYKGTGALIAFDHGMPNNCPTMFFASGASWNPLFPERVTTSQINMLAEKAIQRFKRTLRFLGDLRFEHFPLTYGGSDQDLKVASILIALKRRPRSAVVVSSRVGIPVSECEYVIDRLKRTGWIDNELKPTQRAYRSLKALQALPTKPRSVASPHKSTYVPSQLRAPKGDT